MLRTEQQKQLEAGLREVCTEGAGAMSLILLTPKTSAATVIAAANGDAAAKVVLYAGDTLLRQIHERRSQRNALLCTLCESALWRDAPPDSVAVLLPFGVDAPTAVVGLVFCSCCCADRSDRELALAAVAKLRDGVFGDLRVLPPMPAPGHA